MTVKPVELYIPFLSGIKVRHKCRLCEVTMFIVTGAGKRQVKASRGRKSRVEVKVQDGSQAQGQGRQRSVIQRWSKGTGRQTGSESGREVRQVGTGSGQAKVKTRKTRKERLGYDRS